MEQNTEYYLSNCRYSILKLNADELVDKSPNALELIRMRTIDGVLIKNVLSNNQCNTIIGNLHKLSPKQKFEIHGCGGFLYPITFNQLRPDDNYNVFKERYFKEALEFRKNFTQIFEVDIENIIRTIFSSISGGRPILVPPGISNYETMMPATLRVFEAGRGGVFPHCHNNYDKELNSELVNHFRTFIDFDNQISFFIMIKKPEYGGQLTLFNVEAKEAEQKRGDKDILRYDGSIFDTSLPSNKNLIEVDEGDMFIFAGGNIWHQIEEIQGKKDRITIGGFGTFSKSNSEFYYWS